MKTQIAIIFLILFLGGCTKLPYLKSSIIQPVERGTINLYDNKRHNFYFFKTGHGENTTALLFFIGGSGCTSYKYYMREYLSGLKPGVSVFALQKTGVTDGSTGFFKCSDEFRKNDYFGRWVNDQKRFIHTIVTNTNIRPKQVIVLGVSEGGNVAATVASELPEITHLAIIGSGGMRQIDELKLLDKKHSWNWNIDRAEKEIRQDPDRTDKTFLGHTYKYWSSVMDVDPARIYMNLNIPVLIGVGEEDFSSPVESVHYLANRLNAASRDNVKIVIYKESDHTLVDRQGNKHLKDFIRLVNQWL